MIVSPGSNGISWPSSLKVGMVSLPIALAADHIDRAERRHDVRDHAAAQHRLSRLEIEEAGWPATHAVRRAAAVRHDVGTELAVPALGVAVGFARPRVH